MKWYMKSIVILEGSTVQALDFFFLLKDQQIWMFFSLDSPASPGESSLISINRFGGFREKHTNKQTNSLTSYCIINWWEKYMLWPEFGVVCLTIKLLASVNLLIQPSSLHKNLNMFLKYIDWFTFIVGNTTPHFFYFYFLWLNLFSSLYCH